MIPFIENEVVSKKNWIKNEDMLNIIVIAETTPGPIAINMATFIGKKTSGVFGAFAATVGVCMPSFIIIFLISSYYDVLLNIKILNSALLGIKSGVLFLIVIALFKISKKIKWNAFYITVFLISLICIFVFKLSIIITIIIMFLFNAFYNIIKIKKEESVK